MIYFDSNKSACGFPIDNAIATVDESVWQKHCNNAPGTSWDVFDGLFHDLTTSPAYKQVEMQKRLYALGEKVVKKKQEVAYAGYKFTHGDITYVFDTNPASSGQAALNLSILKDDESISWKVYHNNMPCYVPLSKAEFLQLCSGASTFVREQFNKEEAFIAELKSPDLHPTEEFFRDFEARLDAWK